MNLKAIEARAKAATPGRWTTKYGRSVVSHVPWYAVMPFGKSRDWLKEIQNGLRTGLPDTQANADFIAHAREDIPALIAEVRRLESELHINPEAEIGRLNARLETEILRRDSLGETLDNVVADHKRDIARLADIKAKAVSALSKANPENEKWRCPEFAALAAALEGE